ncbi:MAG: hypothetical protein ACTSR8_06980 [Promethearchaeota archaeon]
MEKSKIIFVFLVICLNITGVIGFYSYSLAYFPLTGTTSLKERTSWKVIFITSIIILAIIVEIVVIYNNRLTKTREGRKQKLKEMTKKDKFYYYLLKTSVGMIFILVIVSVYIITLLPDIFNSPIGIGLGISIGIGSILLLIGLIGIISYGVRIQREKQTENDFNSDY